MNDLFTGSVYFGVCLSLVAYWLGTLLKRRCKLAICNPLLIAIVLTIGVLLLLKVDYATYNAGAKYLSYLLTPATICLAVPLYEQFALLKKHRRALLAGIVTGMLTSLVSVLLLALLLGLDHQAYVTLLPKSVTNAIGLGISQELGGHVALTVTVICITGLLGNMAAETVCRVCRITEPIAKGAAIGAASHAMGTARALEMGRVEGAMSSLSLVVSGLLTVVGAAVFARFF